MTNAAPDSSPVVQGGSTPRPAHPLHVPSSFRIASLKLSVSPSPIPPEFPATATPTMSLDTTGIVVGAAVGAGVVGATVAIVVIGGAVIAVATGCVVGGGGGAVVATVTTT